jgi:hypothetical protein
MQYNTVQYMHCVYQASPSAVVPAAAREKAESASRAMNLNMIARLVHNTVT